MTRVPAIPFRVRVVHKKGANGVALPDQWHSFRTMAGLVDYRQKVLSKPNVYRIESYVLIDETCPTIPQVEPDMKTQSSRDGSSGRQVVIHQNRAQSRR